MLHSGVQSPAGAWSCLTVVPVPGCAPRFGDRPPSVVPDKKEHHRAASSGRYQEERKRSVRGLRPQGLLRLSHLVCQAPGPLGLRFSHLYNEGFE